MVYGDAAGEVTMPDINRRSALVISVAAAIAAAAPAVAADAPTDELRALLERFFAAQNAHDAEAVRGMLLDSPAFLWITPRGDVIWGRDAAIEQFRTFYKGTWKIEPDLTQFRAMSLGSDAAQIFVPVVLTAGPQTSPQNRRKLD